MKVVPEKNWETYRYNTDSGPVIVGFHTDSDKIDRVAFPHCARVIIKIKNPNYNGGPHQDEAEVLWTMEDRLVELLEGESVSCLMLGRLTHGGERELIFQVADWKPFRSPVGRWMMQHENYETDVSEHEGWDFFFDSVWPSSDSWMYIEDRRVVELCIKNGSNPEKPHSIEFVFRGPSAKLEQVQTILMDRDYTVVAFEEAEEVLTMAKSMKLDVNLIYAESLFFSAEAKKLEIEYDGWGCLSVS